MRVRKEMVRKQDYYGGMLTAGLGRSILCTVRGKQVDSPRFGDEHSLRLDLGKTECNHYSTSCSITPISLTLMSVTSIESMTYTCSQLVDIFDSHVTPGQFG